MATAVNPYGDGQAARRSVQALAHFFGLGPRPDEFTPRSALGPSVVLQTSTSPTGHLASLEANAP